LSSLDLGSEVQPTQPPQPLLEIDIPSGYPNVYATTMGDDDMPDIADIGDLSSPLQKSEILHYFTSRFHSLPTLAKDFGSKCPDLDRHSRRRDRQT